MMKFIVSEYNYWIYIILMMIGFYAMMGKRNLIKKLIGMNIFQTAIILYFVSTGVKEGGTVPIIMNHGHHGPIEAVNYVNPLPHVLMLTAIVVMVSTTGVALAVVKLIYNRYRTLEEDEILEMRQ
jgi:multicomponent Na+:H+ antiporter subunit C